MPGTNAPGLLHPDRDALLLPFYPTRAEIRRPTSESQSSIGGEYDEDGVRPYTVRYADVACAMEVQVGRAEEKIFGDVTLGGTDFEVTAIGQLDVMENDVFVVDDQRYDITANGVTRLNRTRFRVRRIPG